MYLAPSPALPLKLAFAFHLASSLSIRSLQALDQRDPK